MLFRRDSGLPEELSERLGPAAMAPRFRAQDVAEKDPDGTLHLARPRRLLRPSAKTVGPAANIALQRVLTVDYGAQTLFSSGTAAPSLRSSEVERPQLMRPQGSSGLNRWPYGRPLMYLTTYDAEPPCPGTAGLPKAIPDRLRALHPPRLKRAKIPRAGTLGETLKRGMRYSIFARWPRWSVGQDMTQLINDQGSSRMILPATYAPFECPQTGADADFDSA